MAAKKNDDPQEIVINTYNPQIDKIVIDFINDNPSIDLHKNFNALLLYINKNINHPDIKDVSNIKELFFNYCMLSDTFNIPITVNYFCIMCGLNYKLLKNIKDGQNGGGANRKQTSMVMELFEMDEAFLNKKAIEGSGISFALLKAKHEYQENPKQTLIQNNNFFSLPIPDRAEKTAINGHFREIE